jgi:hypothetical protein
VVKEVVKKHVYIPPEPHSSTSVFRRGNQGNVLMKLQPTKIYGREYSGHAIERMNFRGLTPMAIENAIKNGEELPNKIAGRL